MPKLAMMLLVLLILPLPCFDAAGGQAAQGDGHGDGMDRYLLRDDRDVQATCLPEAPGEKWGKCCLTRMCGTLCCSQRNCHCIYKTGRGHGCRCYS
uniref:Ctr_76_N conopeptide n=2 Tax=Conoidea TaxID=37797 RepID=A0A0C9S5W6_CONTD